MNAMVSGKESAALGSEAASAAGGSAASSVLQGTAVAAAGPTDRLATTGAAAALLCLRVSTTQPAPLPHHHPIQQVKLECVEFENNEVLRFDGKVVESVAGMIMAADTDETTRVASLPAASAAQEQRDSSPPEPSR